MAVRAKVRKTKAINHGRPPLLKASSATLSSKATRSIIRSHHILHKEHSKAVEQGDAARIRELERTLNDKGGLNNYQLASTLGQSSTRGGDSSKLLVGWLREAIDAAKLHAMTLRVLEIGALSTENAISKIDRLEVTRIDLRSQKPGIQEIDFMELSVPDTERQRYHIISLSLVLNFVPNAAARGAMLQRISGFLTRDTSENPSQQLPCLFLVLPLPCVANSRYLTEVRLEEMMMSLGFSVIKVKKTNKLYYSLWKHQQDRVGKTLTFKKKELRSGSSRNNFTIVLH